LGFNIVADESVDFRIIKYLREKNVSIYSILEKHSGISDEEVVKIAKKNNCILLTEDSDFGEYVFSFQEKQISVIFLRYNPTQINEMETAILKVIQKYNENLYGKFVVITANKIRIREIFK